ncbi:MAG: PqqD family protein [Rhodothermales bacterium]|nr:PqqD family protein [Rhodothermales bacterium]
MAYELSPDIVSTQLDDNEAVLLNLKTRKYYTINETGSVIWNGLKEGKSTDEIADALTAEFEIEKDDAMVHVDEFIGKLVSDGIVTEV